MTGPLRGKPSVLLRHHQPDILALHANTCRLLQSSKNDGFQESYYYVVFEHRLIIALNGNFIDWVLNESSLNVQQRLLSKPLQYKVLHRVLLQEFQISEQTLEATSRCLKTEINYMIASLKYSPCKSSWQEKSVIWCTLGPCTKHILGAFLKIGLALHANWYLSAII